MSATNTETGADRRDRLSWRGRLVFVVFIAMAVAVVWFTNKWLTERYTEATRNRAEFRQALYIGSIRSELQSHANVPKLLSLDPTLISALNAGDFTQSSQRLIAYAEEISAEGLMLLDRTGRVVAASDRALIGTALRREPFFIDALRSKETVFTTTRRESGAFRFTYSRRIGLSTNTLGVIVVEVDLAKFQRSWAGISDAVMVTDSEGRIVLSTEPSWLGLTEAEALDVRSAPNAIQRALRATADWSTIPPDAFLRGQAVMRTTSRIPFRGWRMTSFTTYASVRERVNGVLALEIMGFALALAGAFYLTSRRALSRSLLFQQESAELRQLNAALQREIAEREKAEKNLEVAEQSLQQSSKLAALGEMSAAVSHELNQPLAAMKTYLAGARLLLQRKRSDEALSSFQRIDDLIERMGAITRQLKSYARKGGDAVEPVDVRKSVSSALSMMEPQLKHRTVRINRTLPREPVIVLADPIRLDQVLVNLLRNALDATKSVGEPEVDIVVSQGDTVSISVRDNGTGIKDLDALFEPFYTTKSPGDGVGLGLAISSGIINDFGGRLTARNAANGGAVFEIQLPVHAFDSVRAAE